MTPDAYERADEAIDLALRSSMSFRIAVAAAIEASYRDGYAARDALAKAERERERCEKKEGANDE